MAVGPQTSHWGASGECRQTVAMLGPTPLARTAAKLWAVEHPPCHQKMTPNSLLVTVACHISTRLQQPINRHESGQQITSPYLHTRRTGSTGHFAAKGVAETVSFLHLAPGCDGREASQLAGDLCPAPAGTARLLSGAGHSLRRVPFPGTKPPLPQPIAASPSTARGPWARNITLSCTRDQKPQGEEVQSRALSSFPPSLQHLTQVPGQSTAYSLISLPAALFYRYPFGRQ